MLQPNEYRAHAQKAYDDVEYYEAEAEQSDEPRRSTLLKYARQRQEDAEFYLSRAFIAEHSVQRHSIQAAA
ncbi:hypothetical protein V6R85_01260 [Agrobacterium sp. CCNWLW32]|uniref:hypothetical protein n=1 Tax=Agrobacterium sp. CCNWLW32 TaxID=3122072 RepID=UPI003010130E